MVMLPFSQVSHYSLSFKTMILLLILTFLTLRILCHQSDSGHVLLLVSGVALPFGNGDSSTGRDEALATTANSFFLYDLSKELLTSASSSSAMPASLAEHLNELEFYHVLAPNFIGIVPAPKTSLPQSFSLEQEWIELTQLRLLLVSPIKTLLSSISWNLS
ncbi:hypothetical protein ACH5RR_000950 [Cinchona calisaya]|uniref:Uncharacterized protein n=1 Tax=Cinchona calisaya TaxID=153742 RepID=A0ABD3B259_9GENT